MGANQGKPTALEIQKCAEATGMNEAELKEEYEAWIVRHPSKTLEKHDLHITLRKVLPKYSKEDIKNVTEHVFTVFDSNKDKKISFKEFFMVYHILAFGDTRQVLGQVFNAFDADLDGKISKKEMKAALKDFAKLLDLKEITSEEMFEEMDENHDNKIDAEEFITAVMDNKNVFGQNMAVRLVQMFNTIK